MKIGELQEVILTLGFNMAIERIRSYEKQGLICASKTKKGHREFNDDQSNEAIETLLLIHLGCPVKLLKDKTKNKEAIMDYKEKVKEAIEQLINIQK